MSTRLHKVRKLVKPPSPPSPLPPCRREAEGIVIVLRVPPKSVSPNGRKHWAKKSGVTKALRESARLFTLSVIGAERPAVEAYSYSYFWKSTRRDDDNAIASCKAYLDGIASALGVNDRDLSFRSLTHGNDAKCPRVEITIHFKQP